MTVEDFIAARIHRTLRDKNVLTPTTIAAYACVLRTHFGAAIVQITGFGV